MAEEKAKVSFGAKIKKFFRDYKSEFKKISWPDRKDTGKKTLMVIIAIAVFGICIFGVDMGFTSLFNWLTRIF